MKSTNENKKMCRIINLQLKVLEFLPFNPHNFAKKLRKNHNNLINSSKHSIGLPSVL